MLILYACVFGRVVLLDGYTVKSQLVWCSYFYQNRNLNYIQSCFWMTSLALWVLNQSKGWRSPVWKESVVSVALKMAKKVLWAAKLALTKYQVVPCRALPSALLKHSGILPKRGLCSKSALHVCGCDIIWSLFIYVIELGSCCPNFNQQLQYITTGSVTVGVPRGLNKLKKGSFHSCKIVIINLWIFELGFKWFVSPVSEHLKWVMFFRC